MAKTIHTDPATGIDTIRMGISSLKPGDVVAAKSGNAGTQPVEAGLVVATVDRAANGHARHYVATFVDSDVRLTGGAALQVTVERQVRTPAVTTTPAVVDVAPVETPAETDRPTIDLDAIAASQAPADDPEVQAAVEAATAEVVARDLPLPETTPAERPAAALMDRIAGPRRTTPTPTPRTTTPKETTEMTTLTLTPAMRALVQEAVEAKASAATSALEAVAWEAVVAALGSTPAVPATPARKAPAKAATKAPATRRQAAPAGETTTDAAARKAQAKRESAARWRATQKAKKA